jgi:amino acid transporter
VAVLTGINVFGVSVGKVAQNLLTALKIIGLAGIVGSALFVLMSATSPAAEAGVAAASDLEGGSFAFAMVLVFLTYGGWNDAAFVVADMQDSRRIAPALILGTLAVTGIYLAVNSAYLAALGLDGVRQSNAVAAQVLDRSVGSAGGQAMSALVMVSALGAANGLIYTGSRLYATVGADYAIFGALGRWHPRFHSPVFALAVQAVISLAMIAAVGSQYGQQALNQGFSSLGMEGLNWQGRGGFDSLLRCTAPVFWLFFLLTSVSLFVLRWRDPQLTRPFTAPLYPLLPLVFVAVCGYMLYSGIDYAGRLGLVGGALLLVGLPLYLVSRPTGK